MNNKKNSIYGFLLAMGLTACGGDSSVSQPPAVIDPPAPIVLPPTLVAFDPDGSLTADIKWTSFGVPHITADNLQSLGFGSGYAFAKDNLCILADQFVRVRSERSKYFGPGAGSENIISDFGHLAMQVVDSAEKLYPTMSENSRALMEGYSAGYNKYLAETGVENLAPECAGQPWVKPMTPIDLTAYMFATSQYASGASFIQLAFFANPGDGAEYLPYVGVSAKGTDNQSSAEALAKPILAELEEVAKTFDLPDGKYDGLGSNGWGIGKDKTENGKGILLANPHFPFTGHLRFWQSHNTIPGVLDVTGSSLQGIPGINLIGFNDNLAWTHTVSKSRRFAIYNLSMADGNRSQYIYDDEARDIDTKTFYVEVKAGNTSVVMSKDYFYSHQGLMVETPPNVMGGLMGWSDSNAFTMKDAAEQNVDLIDHWLAMNLAKDLSEFQQAFKDYDGIPWVNTVYADDQGNSFYIDKSRVLNFSDDALAMMRNDPTLLFYRNMAGFDILPGNTSFFETDGLNSYEQAPKLLRNDFVQNSNDPYWATNPAEILSGYSTLYGDDFSQLSLRTRMGLKLLDEQAGEDGKFTPEEVEAALLNNRTYLGDTVLVDLLSQCQAQGTTPVMLDGGMNVDISAGCTALATWNGRMDKDSTAGHLFREFGYKFSQSNHFSVPFDSANPANTPSTLVTDGSALKAFAAAIKNVEASGFALDAALGDLQFTEKTMADGSASGTKFPWAGSMSRIGGFNVFSSASSDSTLYPIHQYPRVTDVETGRTLSSGLSTEGYHLNYGSSWMYIVNFTDDGPKARGILTYSQSSDSSDGSEHFDDQNRYYSDNASLRPMLFKQEDILNDVKTEMVISSN